MNERRFCIIICVILGLLSIPLEAMQFGDKVDWAISDFVVMALLLVGTISLFDEVRSKRGGRISPQFFCGGLWSLFVLIWGELAVGLLGNPLAGS